VRSIRGYACTSIDCECGTGRRVAQRQCRGCVVGGSQHHGSSQWAMVIGAVVYCGITLCAVGTELFALAPFFFLFGKPTGQFVDFGITQGVC
jgi:hypothetical protein